MKNVHYSQLQPLLRKYGLQVSDRQLRRWLDYLNLPRKLTVLQALQFAHFCGFKLKNPSAKMRQYKPISYRMPDNLKQLAAMLNLSEKTVYRWRAKYELPMPTQNDELWEWFQLRFLKELDRDEQL